MPIWRALTSSFSWAPGARTANGNCPHFYKILDHLGFPEKRLRVVALDNHPDRRKTSPDGAEKGWNIEYVPTFIFLKNDKEVGRIVETPAVSLEKDMVNILLKQQ